MHDTREVVIPKGSQTSTARELRLEKKKTLFLFTRESSLGNALHTREMNQNQLNRH